MKKLILFGSFFISVSSYAGLSTDYLTATSSATMKDVTVRPSVTTSTGVIINAVASQSSALLDIRNSAGTTLTQITKDGWIYTPQFRIWRNAGTGTASELYNNTSVTGMTAGITFRTDDGAGSPSGILNFLTGSQGFQVDSNAGITTKFTFVYGGNRGFTELGTALDFYGGSGIKTQLGANGNKGFLTVDTSGIIGVNKTSSIGAQLHIVSSSTVTKGLIIQGVASQSANLTEWQDSSANIGTVVTSDLALAPRPQTLAQLQALSPKAVGEIFYCSDCTTDAIVVSTGTGTGAFARINARTTVIN